MELGRRGIIATTAVGIVIVFAVGLLIGMVVSSGPPDDVVRQEELLELEERLAQRIAAADTVAVVDPQTQPWPYVPLDVELVRKLGHQGHHVASCSYGAFNAIIESLQNEIGYPYDQVPTYMLHFGRGGVAGSGDVCGAVLGSLSAINLIAGEEYRPLAAELIAWYIETPLPTDISNEYAVSHAFFDTEYPDQAFVQTVAGSIACDPSRDTWVATSGYEMGSAERHERCARLTGDVAARAVEILNDWHTDVHRRLPVLTDPEETLAAIYPDAEFRAVEDHVYEVVRNGELIGYVGVGGAHGYNDTIVMAVGISLEGTVHGVHVVEQSETRGLGDVIVEEEFLSQFEGLSAPAIRLQDDDGEIEAVTGATVSCEVAVEIVREQVEYLSAFVPQSE